MIHKNNKIKQKHIKRGKNVSLLRRIRDKKRPPRVGVAVWVLIACQEWEWERMSTTMVDKRKDVTEQRKVDNKSYVPV